MDAVYCHFTSKDEPVAETIAARDQPTLDRYMRRFAETDRRRVAQADVK